MNIQKIITIRRLLTPAQIKNRIPTTSTINYTTKSEDDSWTKIYQFPMIKLLAAFNKLKIYQCGMSALAIPASVALELSAAIPPSSSAVVAALAGSGLATLCIGSLFLKNVVGILYVNEEGTRLKISYPNFWGSRTDLELPINEIIDPSNIATLKWSPATIITTGKSPKYRLLRSFGEVIDQKTYYTIFGQH